VLLPDKIEKHLQAPREDPEKRPEIKIQQYLGASFFLFEGEVLCWDANG
jgi:hypothetical protein